MLHCGKAGAREIVDKAREARPRQEKREGENGERTDRQGRNCWRCGKCVCTLPKTATSADMFMEWTKRSKDHGEEEADNTEGMSRSRRHPCVACGQSGT